MKHDSSAPAASPRSRSCLLPLLLGSASAGSHGQRLLAPRWSAARKRLQDGSPAAVVICALSLVAGWNRARRHLPAKRLLEAGDFLFLFTERFSLWKLSKAGQTWAVAIVALLLGADKCCLDEDVILFSLAASPARLSCLHSVYGLACLSRGGDARGLTGMACEVGKQARWLANSLWLIVDLGHNCGSAQAVCF